MKFSLAWLRRYLETEETAADLAAAMTALGLEVEALDNPAAGLAPFTIARVVDARPHPHADRLQLLSVDAGDGAPLQVVCGAPNARAGLVGVFAAPGAYVPGIDVTLKVAEIRGVQSNGMMCSARELCLGDDHSGIIELPADAPVGAGYAGWAGLDDPVFDVAITPNRQDCMGVHGIARDLAAAGHGRLRPLPAATILAHGAPLVAVATDDPQGCPAFYARSVAGVRNGPSPAWLQRLLRHAGQKPVSALVDITNYLSIGFGRPLHAYDVAKIRGGLRARRAHAGESLHALNGKTYALAPEMTVIADDAAALGIAGIMGGMDSGVEATTTDIIVESAYFDPARIGATGRALGLTSDARARFERGVDPAFVEPGLDLAVAMIVELCGGTASAIVRAGTPPPTRHVVAFDPARTRSLGGVEVADAAQRDILQRLGFAVDAAALPWAVGVPSWRRDIDGAADLVEEIVRLHGLAHVQSVALPRSEGVARPVATPAQKQERRLKRALAARGFDEAVTWSFIAVAEAARFGGAPWVLDNPLSAELAVMRPSLLPGLLAAAARNMARGVTTLRLFEHGRRYTAAGEQPTIALLLAGAARNRDWRFGKARDFDVFDLKTEVQAVLAAAGAPVDRLQVQQPAAGHYHPGRSASLRLGKAVLAEFGELHPDAAGGLEAVCAAEIFLDALPVRRDKRARPAYAALPLQPVRRDFAFLVPADLAAEALLRAVQGADRQLIAEVQLFDRFQGAGGDGRISLALTVTLQPVAQTLTDADLEALGRKVVAAAGKVGAELRR